MTVVVFLMPPQWNRFLNDEKAAQRQSCSSWTLMAESFFLSLEFWEVKEPGVSFIYLYFVRKGRWSVPENVHWLYSTFGTSGAVLLVLCMASTIFAIIRKITIFAFEAKETSTGDVIEASTWWCMVEWMWEWTWCEWSREVGTIYLLCMVQYSYSTVRN